MIKILDTGKVQLSIEEYKILMGLYGAFGLDPYSVTLFKLGLSKQDLVLDAAIYNKANFKDQSLSAILFNIFETVTTTDNYILQD